MAPKLQNRVQLAVSKQLELKNRVQLRLFLDQD